MRVLILSQYFWPETFKITEVATALRDEGCHVTVLTAQPNYPDGKIFEGYSAGTIKKQVYASIEVFRVPIVMRGCGSTMRLVLNYASFILSASIFGPWLLRHHSIDVVFVFAPSPILQAIPGIWLARIKRACLVTWVQDLWPESLTATGFVKNERILQLVAAVVKWIYRKNDCLLVQSEAFISPVKKMAAQTPVQYHPNPGDFTFSISDKSLALLEFGPGFNVVFTGNLGTVQALETIIKAAALLKQERDIRFVLVGTGSRFDWVRSEIDRLGLQNVLLAGRYPPKDMPAIMDRASALLVSLIRSPIMSQTVPSKIQGYLAAGKPIIASLDGEGARIVDEARAGITCPAEDPDALAAAVKTLRDMPELTRNMMCKNALKFYHDNFEPKMLAKRLKSLLTEIKQGAL